MNIVTLRVNGAERDVALAIETLDVVPARRWRTGESRRHSVKHSTSGFAIDIEGVTNPGEVVAEVLRLLTHLQDKQFTFSSLSLQAELSIGVMVGAESQFVPFVDLTPQDLAALGASGVGLSVAGYPASESEREQIQDA